MFIIMSRFVYIVLSRLLLSDLSLLIVFAYFSLPWSTLVEGDEQPVPLVSYSVHEGKHFFVSAVSGLFLKLIYNGARHSCSSPATKLLHDLAYVCHLPKRPNI